MSRITNHSSLTVTMLLIAFGSFGCVPRFSSHSIGNGNVTTLSYQADWRAANIIYRPSLDPDARRAVNTEIAALNQVNSDIDLAKKTDPKGSVDALEKKKSAIITRITELNAATAAPFILSEPPPQMANEFTFNLKGSVDKVNVGQFDLASKAEKLFEVAGYNLAIRDALYRLNEAYMFGGIDVINYRFMFSQVIEAATVISKNDSDAKVAIAKAARLKEEAEETKKKADETESEAQKVKTELDSLTKKAAPTGDEQKKIKSLQASHEQLSSKSDNLKKISALQLQQSTALISQVLLDNPDMQKMLTVPEKK